MLDLETLRARYSAGEQFEFLFFWGHQPSADGRVTNSCFSQWYRASFVIDGILYPTAEHWMMAAKARLFGDQDILPEILNSSDPKDAKALGRQVRGFDETVWSKRCRQLVTEGNFAKFQQNEKLGSFLRGTGAQVLVEASPFDRIWGIGLRANDKRANYPHQWQGENLLGFALMDVRDQLRGGG